MKKQLIITVHAFVLKLSVLHNKSPDLVKVPIQLQSFTHSIVAVQHHNINPIQRNTAVFQHIPLIRRIR